MHNEAKRDLQAAVIKANEEEASEHNKEMKLWEGTLLDGLEP